MKVGRNDPCPCGSGKKYKKCCLSNLDYQAPFLSGFSPSELVAERCRAFDRGDFGFIYDTYHKDSYFLKQFPDRYKYVQHGQSFLARDFSIHECRILKEDIQGGEARILFYLDTLWRGDRSESFELAHMIKTEMGWRYHSSQKLERAEFAGRIEDIDWEDFEKVKDKVFF